MQYHTKSKQQGRKCSGLWHTCCLLSELNQIAILKRLCFFSWLQFSWPFFSVNSTKLLHVSFVCYIEISWVIRSYWGNSSQYLYANQTSKSQTKKTPAHRRKDRWRWWSLTRTQSSWLNQPINVHTRAKPGKFLVHRKADRWWSCGSTRTHWINPIQFQQTKPKKKLSEVALKKPKQAIPSQTKKTFVHRRNNRFLKIYSRNPYKFLQTKLKLFG